MRHLDAAAMHALSTREPEAVAYFREHLAAPCEVCETFLAHHAGPGLLDGEMDAALLRLAPAPAAEDLPPLRALKPPRRLPSPSARQWGWMGGALAASLLAVVLVPSLRTPSAVPEAPWTGVKGPGRISLELAVVAQGLDGQLRRLDAGAAVAPEDVLLLRYHATEAGTALLYQQRAGQPPELLGRFPLEAGTHDLEGPQGLAGVSLEGDEGSLRLALVAFAAGETPSEDAALVALGAGEAAEHRPGTVARFDVHVQPGQTPPRP
ncbi:serine/threonine-protein kinase [Stigmatella hybrida]|uniref:hypothetical protein n=1 Tax=Stigmatella hybrida TaxID=394097 RepID=UPI001CDB1E72|nr:hypothetical protein [Stigmatella hybrida]